MIRKFLVGAATAALALSALAGCGSDAHNDADITFATGMIPHHAGAVEMAKLVPARSTTPAVVDLAKRIEKAQQPEIDMLTGWLDEWGAAHGTGHNGHEGMADTDRLDSLSGPAFDREFLDLMIVHHEGAVAMAGDEIRDGKHPGARELAQRIVTDQHREIEEMRDLLKSTT
ncbi:DUF305 domain-containing protein [Saccharothrix violaceirubra]|uniref:Uncharacterized protein (DUF305 family) n=1 Tax=Saccharothrix violaceirubra TaxID=413306 RepID=A0A7W7T677_9PSEU|nr:DUF305 domain-containing protein [Saccharothrix violaceirubra]MBB4967076.1 uncharacterized protein (DUF305 family) [Saccharothrix violaceirubra]